jgi:hypothetical protein
MLDSSVVLIVEPEPYKDFCRLYRRCIVMQCVLSALSTLAGRSIAAWVSRVAFAELVLLF